MLSNDEKVMLSNSGQSRDNYSSFDSIRNQKQSSDEDMIDIKSISSVNNGEQKGFILIISVSYLHIFCYNSLIQSIIRILIVYFLLILKFFF